MEKQSNQTPIWLSCALSAPMMFSSLYLRGFGGELKVIADVH